MWHRSGHASQTSVLYPPTGSRLIKKGDEGHGTLYFTLTDLNSTSEYVYSSGSV